MRIAAFEVRDDEKDEFARQAKRAGVDELVCHEGALDPSDLGCIEGFDAVLVLGANHYDADFLAGIAGRGVAVLVGRTVGIDYIDTQAAADAGLLVSNISYSPDSVADFTCMLILVALRKYKPAIYLQNVNDFSLSELMGKTLSSQTVGIVGTGAIGSAVATRLAAFGCKILAYGHHQNPAVAQVGTYVDLETLYRESDIVSFHVPDRADNHHMVNARTLAQMKDGVMLVNTARAGLMDIECLIKGIETGKIGSLAMDVFDGEQGIYHRSHVNEIIANRDMAYLRQFPNTVLTQHMAFCTQQAVNQMVAHAVDKALELGRRG